ncbi:hypothetical protein B0H13DRAFT_2325655 [Mycena leptocephala]|nr:hypothetical protein B0H13DRAFT_2325655 [Mycena leptocephala]
MLLLPVLLSVLPHFVNAQSFFLSGHLYAISSAAVPFKRSRTPGFNSMGRLVASSPGSPFDPGLRVSIDANTSEPDPKNTQWNIDYDKDDGCTFTSSRGEDTRQIVAVNASTDSIVSSVPFLPFNQNDFLAAQFQVTQVAIFQTAPFGCLVRTFQISTNTTGAPLALTVSSSGNVLVHPSDWSSNTNFARFVPGIHGATSFPCDRQSDLGYRGGLLHSDRSSAELPDETASLSL